jgi:hypothetical protein
MSKKVIIVSTLFGMAVGVAIAYFLCRINPAIEAGWLRGLWHGANLVPNWILSFFDDRLVQAPLHSTAYSVFWWLSAISSIIFVWIANIVKLIRECIKK